MCTLAAVMIGVSVAQAGAQYVAQSQQAAATEKYNQQLQINATQAYDSSTAQGQTQQIYQDIKAAHAIDEENRNARANEATVADAAGEAGVGGNTMMELSRDYFNKAGRADSDILVQRDAANNQIEQQIIGSGFQYQDRLNQRKVVSEPSLLSPLLTIGSSAISSLSNPKLMTMPSFSTLFGGIGSGDNGDNNEEAKSN